MCGWRRGAAEWEEGWRQGRQVGVRGRGALDSVLMPCRPVFEPASSATVAVQPSDDPRDVPLVSSGTRSSPRHSFCPFRLLDLPPEKRDRKGITGILSFQFVSLRALAVSRTCNPLFHVFHPLWTVPEWDVFLMKRGCLPGYLSRELNSRQGANPWYPSDRHFISRQQTLPPSHVARPFSRL